MESFEPPEFSHGRDLEFRVDNGEVCIYGTPTGLRRLSDLILRLSAHTDGPTNHIHLDDYELLTPRSLKAVIAVYL